MPGCLSASITLPFCTRKVFPVRAAIQLRLASDRVQVVICVWDASPQPPVRVDAAEDAKHGRGLLLVEAVSKQWGWFPAESGSPWVDGHHGKVVWAMVS